MLPEVDTLDTAYVKAYAQSRRGRSSVQLICNAQGRRYKHGLVTVWRDLPGIKGYVLQRLPDADGVIERLVVQAEVVDILAAHTDEFIKRVSDPVPKPKTRISTSR